MTNRVTQTSIKGHIIKNNSRLKKIDTRLTRIEDRLTKLEMQMANLAIRFSDLENRFELYRSESDIKFHRIMSILDTHTGMLQDMLLELRERDNVVERYDKWIKQIAKTANINLAYNA
jgi:predicted nuclease with TOPRIM domain